ncbi:MAG TPA: single-stranded-DNA-specific exonuclease RecJ [Geminicoccaceae bacterium]|nr:single-stranded-DNA-specific exonuclease RecJ [Geminicoccus sp.]HMU49209.1 single-stranded-DNA-specific exonuclease RecJ [Geminicoccaceae bacterium]
MEVGRSALGRAWRLRSCDERLALALSQRLGLEEVVARVMAGRGIGLDQAADFLEPRLRSALPDPSHLLDLDRAAARIADAVEDGQKVGIVGDYDVDGATSTALFVRYLRSLGVQSLVEIPDRIADGYGPNRQALARLAAAGCGLVVTLDTGTTAFAPLDEAAEDGLEVVVIDHHAAEDRLPRALAVVNPNRLDQQSPLQHLAAVGVTFVVTVAVSRELRGRGFFRHRPEPDPLQWLDLVALGTVCDVVPLAGLNRAFVRQGLKVLRQGSNPGLAALAQAAGIAAVTEAWQLGFALGPRLNAGGRIGRSDLAARLLATDDPGEASGLAQRLDELNARRQAMEREQLALAEAAVADAAAAGAPVLVAGHERLHPGIVGILASRLVERFHRPCFVVALDGQGMGKGSARSVPGFDLGAAVILARTAGLLTQGGGHPMAAGLSMSAARLGELAAFMAERVEAATLAAPGAPGPLELDGALAVGGVTSALALQVERLSPFGAGNVEPSFALADARVVETRPVGDSHLACTLTGAAGGRLRAVAFRSRGTPLADALLRGEPLRVAGRVKVDRWQGREGASFHIEDAAAAE